MRPEVTALRSNYQSKRKTKQIYPGDHCARCGMHVSEHKNQWGKGMLQLHHIKPISQCVDEGILNPQWVNSKDNLDSLCYFCHREWHTFGEPLGMNYLEWKAKQSVLDLFGREPLGDSLDSPADKFNRKARPMKP